MSEIINITQVNPSASVSAKREGAVASATPVPSIADRVEISPQGRLLAKAIAQSSFRLARTQAIRSAIQNGTYETPERLQGTVERLLDVLA